MLNVRLHDNTTRAGNAAELSLGSRASGQEYLCTPHEATVSAISLRSKKQFWGYKGPCLPMSSPLHKPDLLFHPKLSFKMSSSNDFSLPAAKCYHCLAWEPCEWAYPVGIHRDISGGIWSSLHTRVTASWAMPGSATCDGGDSVAISLIVSSCLLTSTHLSFVPVPGKLSWANPRH